MKDKNHNLATNLPRQTTHKAAKMVLHEERKLLKALQRQRKAAVHRFPLLFTLLGTFGLVATFYGFEHMIDRVPWLVNNPIILLGAGLVTLLITGTLYKKLS